MVELGAGRGDWCLAIAGIIDNKLVDTCAKSYRCVAVEAEPTHFKWTKEHFEKQNINAVAVWGAAYNYNGECWLSAEKKPQDHYGQGVCSGSGNVAVPCFTLREIMIQHNLNKIDILHMDIQGAELDVIIDSVDLIAAGLVRYVLIGTHKNSFNSTIRNLLGEFIDFSVDIQPKLGFVDTPFGPANMVEDGILFGKSKVPDPTLVDVDKSKETQIRVSPNDMLNFNIPMTSETRKVMPFWHLENSVTELLKNDQELKACRLIRRWAAQRANIPTYINSDKDSKQDNLEKYLAGYEEGAVATICGATSDFLAHLYSYFGFSSAILNVGPKDGFLTHMMTLVVLCHENREYTLIQDAYINAEYAVGKEEVTTFGRYLNSIVSDPSAFRFADHYPDDRRSGIGILNSDNSFEFCSVKMFELLRWFYSESHTGMREFMSAKLNKPINDVLPQDMFLFPKDVIIIKNSERLHRELLYYEIQLPIIRKLMVNSNQISEIDRTALENALELL